MLKIKSLKEKSEKLKEFEKIQWRLADIEHYGRETWKAKTYIFIAEEKDKRLGFIKFDIAAGVCHIEALLVSKAKRRIGVGKTLIEKAEKISRKLKVHKIYLYTGKKWDSTKFYESFGYEIAAIFPDHYGHQDFVQYAKFLK
ncbi:hypothetical protein A3F00_05005 [Candidatus Daviesbacteria bacterium RIFCSPHIGHO2_12_FULL_37_11]|uniref:N-acetyltransferase domain-containing protein n=1 Tax=Candidatus Daviesbacteria bacterium RIFCSPHIGHO2_12_FULL_37_11 TaxID=1797777 RepID=A0A1F5K9L6_9BACT|nr:MAG: hypothetical protein A3F00_05005 [Candidatus Daviesbacteria bacterium RIFCSPHIGHO2_12_FULL_37_11]OGE46033.1 MAG: hypothetical protein A3B39_03425 [Candidatus Daviesbacteria bacterium RIFCSPLOWO2_01_FULL_37_10]